MTARVIGLAFVTPVALQLTTRKAFDLRTFPGEGAFRKWLNGDHDGRRPVAVVEDKDHFQGALRSGVGSVICLIPDLDWMGRRSIPVLDAKRQDDAIEILNITPAQIEKELGGTAPYVQSEDDKWLQRGSPEGRCAGCQHLLACGHHPTPLSKQPCGGGEFEKATDEEGYRCFGLSQLVHVVLNQTDEEKRACSAKEFWEATFGLALGTLTGKEWVSRYARPMKTAGASKRHLKYLLAWSKRFGPRLQRKETRSPITQIDLRAAEKLVTAERRVK